MTCPSDSRVKENQCSQRHITQSITPRQTPKHFHINMTGIFLCSPFYSRRQMKVRDSFPSNCSVFASWRQPALCVCELNRQVCMCDVKNNTLEDVPIIGDYDVSKTSTTWVTTTTQHNKHAEAKIAHVVFQSDLNMKPFDPRNRWLVLSKAHSALDSSD